MFIFYSSDSSPIEFESIDTKHCLYSELKEDESIGVEDEIIAEDFKSFRKNDSYEITPVTLKGQTYNESFSPSQEEYHLILDNTNGDLTFLVSDYEITFDTSETHHSTIIQKENGKVTQIHYDIIDKPIIRFVISDYGRIISFSQKNKDENFSESKCYMFSAKDDKEVSIRFSTINENTVENITANF